MEIKQFLFLEKGKIEGEDVYSVFGRPSLGDVTVRPTLLGSLNILFVLNQKSEARR